MQAIQAVGPAQLVTPVLRRRAVTRHLLVADAFVIAVSSLVAYWLRAAVGSAGVLEPLTNEIPTAIGVIPLWLTVLYATGAYSPYHLASGIAGIRRFLGGASMSMIALGFLSFAANLQLSRLYALMLFVCVVVGGVGSRAATRASLRRKWSRGEGIQRTLIVGVNEESMAVADAMGRDSESGYEVAGFLDDHRPAGTKILGDLSVIGPIQDDAVSLAHQYGAGLVVVAPSAVEPGTLRRLAVGLEGSEIDLAIAPSLFEVVTRRLTVESIGNVPLLQVEQIRLDGMRAVAKRTLDIVGALLLLAFAWPVMAISAMVIRFDSQGPIIFRQRRVGKDQRPFTILKFRTMTDDAEDRLGEVIQLNEAGHHFFKIRQDPRITGVGRSLRKWSIDELPQLWNVLRGDMSLVGPRPPLPAEVDKYEDWHLRRLRVRPGITGLWQVSGRSDVEFDEAARLDIFYIENWSVGLDLAIALRTARAVLGRDGAF
ncbi:MAG: sugar transferase [Acidimicrobiia bacterium]|nr:sugar transferase [Acidimicrobiia bacterium]